MSSDELLQSANALRQQGEAARRAGDRHAATRYYEEAVALLRRADAPLRLAHTIRHLGDVHREMGNAALAEPCYDEALAIYRGNPHTTPLDLANAIRSMAVLKDDAALWQEAHDLYVTAGVHAGVAEAAARRVVVAEEPLSALDEYTEIPSKHPGPAAWPFDLSRWGVLTARIGGRRVGGAVVAFDTPGVTMLEGRSDLAVLWDVRVAPDVRRKGVGTALFRAAERWALAKGCRQLKIETQDTNVPACRLYEREGCVLRERHPQGDEVQLLWYKDLA